MVAERQRSDTRAITQRARSDALPEHTALKDGGHPHDPAKGPNWDGGQIRRARSDALPEHTALKDGGHPHAPAKGPNWGGGQTRRARSDALPEHTRYVDTGCDVHPSCLSCPLVRCRYDEPGGTRRLLSEGRDRAIVALRRAGMEFEEIAIRFGVSRRTVFRALARGRESRADRKRIGRSRRIGGHGERQPGGTGASNGGEMR